ncbi:CPBP family glutamic-type intramembrane protease [Parasphingopyxis sp.]|uniref:CPBP family glutamic-type intramembrane protease n=1 Tax=Parasphingopyxis sp. TaxID=1920299 RepID=UPI0026362837|nr:CPBP family glutamic-type intramembrane protease [Parasphingopyxis sp.]
MNGVRETFQALKTWPSSRQWAWSLSVIVPTIIGLALLFLIAGLARWSPVQDVTVIVSVAAMLFVAPALLEELLFRGVLLKSGSVLSAVLSVSAFIAWHPLQVYTIGPPWAAQFLDPAFLLGVAVLGIALAHLRLRTASLWPPIMLHWIVVAGWKLLLDGPF